MSKIILPIEELKDLYVEQCWSRKEIAEYFNTTVSIVSKRLTENNITRTSQQEQKYQKLYLQFWQLVLLYWQPRLPSE